MTTPLERFFDSPNSIDLNSLGADLADLVQRLSDRLQVGQRTVLPAVVGGHTRWYGIAPDARSGRLLQEELRAWFGWPIGADPTFVVRPPGEPVDEAALVIAGEGVALRVDIDDRWRRTARSNAERLLNVWMTRPPREEEAIRPIGRVLREFYEAVGAGNESSALSLLSEIRDGAMLTPRNALFLEVRLLHGVGRYSEITDGERLSRLRDLDLPRSVVRLVAEAVDQSEINPALPSLKSTEFHEFKERFRRDFGWVVRSRAHATTLSTARCFILAHSASGIVPFGDLQQVAAEWPDDEVLSQALGQGDETPESAIANETSDDDDGLGVWRPGGHERLLQALETSPDYALAMHAITFAADLEDAEYSERVLHAIRELPTQLRVELEEHPLFLRRRERVESLCEAELFPDNWLDWLDGDWPDRPDLLDDRSADWDWDTINHDEFALRLLEALEGEQRGRLRNGLPILITRVVRNGLRPSLVPLAVNLAVVVSESSLGNDGWSMLFDVAQPVLSVGCSSAEYEELMSALVRAVGQSGSNTAETLADLVELVYSENCPHDTSRQLLVGAIQSKVAGWQELLDEPIWLAIDAVLGLGGLTLPDRSEQPLSDEAGLLSRDPVLTGRLLIYSLLVPAARRARDWILERYPEVSVELSEAHDNSPQLVTQVRAADMVLIHTSHAKHAATDAIQAAAARGDKLVLVHGRGASALFQAFLRRLEASALVPID